MPRGTITYETSIKVRYTMKINNKISKTSMQQYNKKYAVINKKYFKEIFKT